MEYVCKDVMYVGIDLQVLVAVFTQNDQGRNITCHRESYAKGCLDTASPQLSSDVVVSKANLVGLSRTGGEA